MQKHFLTIMIHHNDEELYSNQFNLTIPRLKINFESIEKHSSQNFNSKSANIFYELDEIKQRLHAMQAPLIRDILEKGCKDALLYQNKILRDRKNITQLKQPIINIPADSSNLIVAKLPTDQLHRAIKPLNTNMEGFVSGNKYETGTGANEDAEYDPMDAVYNADDKDFKKTAFETDASHVIKAIKIPKNMKAIITKFPMESQQKTVTTSQILLDHLLNMRDSHPLYELSTTSMTSEILNNSCLSSSFGITGFEKKTKSHQSLQQQSCVKTLILPVVIPVPKYLSWVAIRANSRAEDNVTMRAFPYFGEEDDYHMDVCLFDEHPGDLEPELKGEVEETTFMHLLTKYAEFDDKNDIYSAPDELLEAFIDGDLFKTQVLDKERLSTAYLNKKYKELVEAKLAEENMAEATSESRALVLGSVGMARLEAPIFVVAYRNSERYKNKLGLKRPEVDDYLDMADTYRRMFCRRCYVYDCKTHGMEHPMPVVRTDPPAPPSCPVPNVSLPTDCIRRSNANRGSRKRNVSDRPGENTSKSTDIDENGDTFSGVPYRMYANAVMSDTDTDMQSQSQSHTGVKRQKQFSPEEAVLMFKLAEVFGAQRADAIALLVGTRTPDEVQRFLSESDAVPATERGFTKRKNDSCGCALGDPGKRCTNGTCASRLGVGVNQDCDVGFLARQEEFQVQSVTDSSSVIGDAFEEKNNQKKNGRSNGNSSTSTVVGGDMCKPAKVRREFVPCTHPGLCAVGKADCVCCKNGSSCEKFCACLRTCKRRFPGCRCKTGQCRSNSCKCFIAGRECDPDLCFTCGISIHPTCMSDIEKQLQCLGKTFPVCRNGSLQTFTHGKCVAVGRSSIHGWGVFIQENADKNDFIMEYTGEIISQEEADRRGKVYDKFNVSFLFQLNEETVVDSTRKGNAAKFINHSETDFNVAAKVLLVNGDHRICMYAARNIISGEELSFNYQTIENQPKWLNKKTKGFTT